MAKLTEWTPYEPGPLPEGMVEGKFYSPNERVRVEIHYAREGGEPLPPIVLNLARYELKQEMELLRDEETGAITISGKQRAQLRLWTESMQNYDDMIVSEPVGGSIDLNAPFAPKGALPGDEG